MERIDMETFYSQFICVGVVVGEELKMSWKGRATICVGREQVRRKLMNSLNRQCLDSFLVLVVFKGKPSLEC